MKDCYTMTIASCERNLPLCRASEDLVIAGFVIFGDVELTKAAATELLKIAPDFDHMLAPEAKAIPLIYEMARQTGRNEYLIARKAPKLYMKDVKKTEVKSITTEAVQTLYIDSSDAEKMKGKRILLVDDVISTGESIAAAEKLVNECGGIVAGRMSILAEGKAAERDDIVYLEKLPLFDNEGNPLE